MRLCAAWACHRLERKHWLRYPGTGSEQRLKDGPKTLSDAWPGGKRPAAGCLRKKSDDTLSSQKKVPQKRKKDR